MKYPLIAGIVVVMGLGAVGWYLMSVRPTSVAFNPTQRTATAQQQDPDPNVPPVTPTEQATGAMPSVTVLSSAHDSAYGDRLIAQNGRTLYYFTKDTQGVSNCAGACSALWIPYTPVAGQLLTASSGISGTLKTIILTDGSAQLTYNGMPLYYYKKDLKAGDITGDGVNHVWFVAKP